MPLRFTPYLNFNKQCADAFRFYHEVFGGELTHLQTHADTPMKEFTPPEWHDAIMHARLVIGDTTLMGSDMPPGQTVQGPGYAVAIGVDDPAEADRIYAALAEGGQQTMPMQQTFWAKRFGMLTDRFGIPWMINCE